MAIILTTSSGPTANLTLDLASLNSRVAAILQRDDLSLEIDQWLNFVQRDLAKRIKFHTLLVGVETAMISTPATFSYDLPSDYSMADRVYYKNTTDANNNWGRNLIPIPRKFYAGDVVDFERLLNTSVPSIGDPLYYWIDRPNLKVYPALADNLTGKLQFWYYRLPNDMTLASQEPDIPNEYRHYLIWLALYWGKALLEQADITKVSYWQKHYDRVVTMVAGYVTKSERERETIWLPENGLEQADGVY